MDYRYLAFRDDCIDDRDPAWVCMGYRDPALKKGDGGL